MFFDQGVIRGGIFFGDNFGSREIMLQFGALNLSRLLFESALGYQDQAMPCRKILQCRSDLRQELDRTAGDGVSETLNLSVQFSCDWLDAKPLEGAHQRVREAVQPVAMSDDAFALHIVEDSAHQVGRKLVVIEK